MAIQYSARIRRCIIPSPLSLFIFLFPFMPYRSWTSSMLLDYPTNNVLFLATLSTGISVNVASSCLLLIIVISFECLIYSWTVCGGLRSFSNNISKRQPDITRSKFVVFHLPILNIICSILNTYVTLYKIFLIDLQESKKLVNLVNTIKFVNTLYYISKLSLILLRLTISLSTQLMHLHSFQSSQEKETIS